MALNLKKGQKIDLAKKGETLGNLLVGLGWDPVSAAKGGGFFKKLFASTPEIDCDASVLMLEAGDKFVSNKDLIYYGHLKSACGSIRHTGDNLTGEGEGDDEQIMVDLSKVPERYTKLVFVVNIYSASSRKQHFGMIQNCFIRVYDQSNRKELVRYNIDEDNDGKVALIVASVARDNGGWKFEAIGEATMDYSVESITQRYQ